ncbi:MAG: ribonuclease P protein component [Trueperaceae bacterium]|nr:ribonuclease P protein component [Trueperaceae bacterium]
MPTVVRSLKGDRAFQRLRRGRSGGARLLSVRWRPVREPGLRVGIVASRKVGNAVVRNRVRRRLREALRALVADRDLGERGVDLLVIARPSAADADYHALRDSLRTALERSSFP